MNTARDIALVFLALEAVAVAIIPLVFLAAMAYGVYRLRRWVWWQLRQAQQYAQRAHALAERASYAVASPFIRVHATARMVTTILTHLIPKTGARRQV